MNEQVNDSPNKVYGIVAKGTDVCAALSHCFETVDSWTDDKSATKQLIGREKKGKVFASPEIETAADPHRYIKDKDIS